MNWVRGEAMRRGQAEAANLDESMEIVIGELRLKVLPSPASHAIATSLLSDVVRAFSDGTGVSLRSCSAWLFVPFFLLMAVCCVLPVLAFHTDWTSRAWRRESASGTFHTNTVVTRKVQ